MMHGMMSGWMMGGMALFGIAVMTLIACLSGCHIDRRCWFLRPYIGTFDAVGPSTPTTPLRPG